MANALSVNVKTADCPDGDSAFSAMLFGKLVGAAKIEPRDRIKLQMFMEVAYEEHVSRFNKGLALEKQAAREVDSAAGAGSHGGKVPEKAQVKAIEELKGMPWPACVAVSAVLFSGAVPTEAEIEREGYGSDPAQWESAKVARKQGRPNLLNYIKSRDAEGYRAMITKGATRMAAAPRLATAAAHLMLFINKLSRMTFDQGMAGLFLDYCEEHFEQYKGEGLASAANPLDQAILTETVLAEKNKSRDTDQKMDKVIEALEAQNLSLSNSVKSSRGEVNALASKVAQLEKELAGKKTGKGPPSEDNPCQFCGSPEHFIRDCPKKKEADARKKASAEAGTSSAEK